MARTVGGIAAAVLGVLCFVGGYSIGKDRHRSPINAKTDTLFVYERKWADLPSFEGVTLKSWAFFTETVSDTTQIEVPVVIKDTIYVPITQKYYEQLDGRLRIWVSGYAPQLDRWELDEQSKIIREKSHWGLSVGVGPSVIYTPFHKVPIDAGVGVFAGVTYTF